MQSMHQGNASGKDSNFPTSEGKEESCASKAAEISREPAPAKLTFAMK